MSRTNVIILYLMLLLCCIIGSAQSETSANTNTQSGSTAASSSTPASAEQTTKLEARLNNYFIAYRNAQWRYSWAYHICIYGAAIFSALAALLSKIHIKSFGLADQSRRDNWTASLAAMAALLIAISTAGKLQDSWQENRPKRYAVEGLMNQFAAEQNPTSEELEAYGKRLALVIDPNTAPVELRTEGFKQ